MKIIIKPSAIDGEIQANPSKSYMQRAVAIAALYKLELFIRNPCLSEDCMAALSVAKAMGCRVVFARDALKMIPGRPNSNNVWRIGESGFSARIFGIIATLFKRKITIQGHGSILGRSMASLEETIGQLGAECQSNGSHLPFDIKGPVTNKKVSLDASGGSQVLSGLLLALPATRQDAEIQVKDLKSKPYIDITIQMLQEFGIRISHNQYREFSIKGNQKAEKKSFNIEGDWSGSAFFGVAAAISGTLKIDQLNRNSLQGDKAILKVLELAGAIVSSGESACWIQKNQLKAFEYNATDTPDLFPPLAALAANCPGRSRIKGVGRLSTKESDRYLTLKSEFSKLGVQIIRRGDWMLVEGGNGIKGGKVKAHNDHRIAMALAVLALNAEGPVEIDGIECVAKSYPGFLRDLKKVGGVYAEREE